MVQASDVSAPRKWPRMSYEEYLCDPTIPEHTEWVDGEVIEMMSVSKAHSEMLDFVLEVLHTFFRHARPGKIYVDPFNMKASADAPGRAPDIAFVLTEHLDRVRENHLEGPADLVVEIISPGTEATDRGEKYYEYQAGGVREYWLIDPVREVADFYVRDAEGVFRSANVADDAWFDSTVIQGLRIRVEWLWSRPPCIEIERELVAFE